MRRKLIILAVAVALCCCILFPQAVSQGAGQGLMLWFNVVFPALLPFMILSGVIVRLGISGVIGRVVYPIMHRLLGVSRNGCYPIVIGLLSGYPLGAKTVSDLCVSGRISRKEGQFLLGICNNASPMFLLEYMGVYCLGMSQPFWILAVIYLSAFLGAAIGNGRKQDFEALLPPEAEKGWEKGLPGWSVMEAVDTSILDAFVTTAKVGGYIILFSILVRLMQKLLLGESFLEILLMGVLEITTGGEAVRALGGNPYMQWMVGIGICAFGGLSSIAQTSSVIRESGLSIKGYIAAKLRHAIIAVILTALFLLIIR